MSTTVENRLQSPQTAQMPRAGAVKNRRRPALAALAVLIIALGGMGSWVGFSLLSNRVQVLTVVKDVPAGTQVSEEHLGQAGVALEPGVKSVPVADKGEVVGKRAKVALTAGSLLHRGQVTDEQLVKAGEQVIPVGLKPALLPASSLVPGQAIQIMRVPGPGGNVDEPSKGEEADEAATVVEARVVKLGEARPGSEVTVVDVAVASEDGPSVAAWSSQEQAAVAVSGGGS